MPDKKGGHPQNGTPGVALEPLSENLAAVKRAFDRKTYQREYMRRYRAEGRDRSKTPSGNERGQK